MNRTRMLIVLLLGLLVGLGGWNYKRNLEMESQDPRTFAEYSDQDVEVMKSAMQGEVENLEAAYQAAMAKDTSAKAQTSSGDRFQDFKRVQEETHEVRELGMLVSQKQKVLRELKQEARYRSERAMAFKTHLRRLTTI